MIESLEWLHKNGQFRQKTRADAPHKRNAWLFSGSPRGTTTAATLYSLIETAKANNLEPHRYLLNVIERVPTASTPDDYRALLPQHIDLTSI